MKKDTRNYRKNFARGGSADWMPPPTAEDAAGNLTYGHYDAWGNFKPGESSEEETRNSLAHPGRTVPSVDRLMDVYPIGSHKEREKLDKAVQNTIKTKGELYPGAGTMSTLYPKATDEYFAQQDYNKGGVVRKRRK
ncbi:MAG TPA: hypothetical protein VF077_10955 [Nitrospiraceae bacterium]